MLLGSKGVGFRVWGLGFRVWGLGFGVKSLGFQGQSVGFRVEGSGLSIWGFCIMANCSGGKSPGRNAWMSCSLNSWYPP